MTEPPDNFGVKVLRILAEMDRKEAEWRREFMRRLVEKEERLILGTKDSE